MLRFWVGRLCIQVDQSIIRVRLCKQRVRQTHSCQRCWLSLLVDQVGLLFLRHGGNKLTNRVKRRAAVCKELNTLQVKPAHVNLGLLSGRHSKLTADVALVSNVRSERRLGHDPHQHRLLDLGDDLRADAVRRVVHQRIYIRTVRTFAVHLLHTSHTPVTSDRADTLKVRRCVFRHHAAISAVTGREFARIQNSVLHRYLRAVRGRDGIDTAKSASINLEVADHNWRASTKVSGHRQAVVIRLLSDVVHLLDRRRTRAVTILDVRE